MTDADFITLLNSHAYSDDAAHCAFHRFYDRTASFQGASVNTRFVIVQYILCILGVWRYLLVSDLLQVHDLEHHWQHSRHSGLVLHPQLDLAAAVPLLFPGYAAWQYDQVGDVF